LRSIEKKNGTLRNDTADFSLDMQSVVNDDRNSDFSALTVLNDNPEKNGNLTD